jgi:hypothetical protein
MVVAHSELENYPGTRLADGYRAPPSDAAAVHYCWREHVASYPIYILHQTVIITIGYFVIQEAWAPWVKYWIVLSGTLVSCIVMYELCIRRFALSRILFGMKRIDTPKGTTATVPLPWAVQN